MKKIMLSLVFFQMLILSITAQVKLQQLRTENLTNPIGLGVVQPRFSWQLVSNKRNTMQSAYEIMVTAPALSNKAVWKSGKINGDASVHVTYNGDPLKSGVKYTWKVKVWNNENKASEWSEPAFFQTALLNLADWKAKWIEPGYTEDSVMRPSSLFRKEFKTTKKIKSATAYITAHGMYEAQINGKRIGDAYLTPGWTSYKKRLQYQTYDVTSLLSNGSNAIGVTLGSGWYRGIIGFINGINYFGKDIALLLQLDITYTDGTAETVISDDSWKSSTGPIRYSEIYNGETIDARLEKNGWTLPGYNDKDWDGVKVKDHSKENLVATVNEPVRKHEVFKPLRIFTTPAGEKV